MQAIRYAVGIDIRRVTAAHAGIGLVGIAWTSVETILDPIAVGVFVRHTATAYPRLDLVGIGRTSVNIAADTIPIQVVIGVSWTGIATRGVNAIAVKIPLTRTDFNEFWLTTQRNYSAARRATKAIKHFA